MAAALLLAACSAETPFSRTAPDEAAPAEVDSTAASPPRIVEVGAKAAALAYVVAAYSPLLTEAQRTAISQNFNGAPLSSEPQVHTVTAESLSCLARKEIVGEGTHCSIDYGAESRDLAGEEAKHLFDALGSAGVESADVESVSSVSRIERAIANLICTVDDTVAQGVSSTGDEINGFSCRFRVST
jgi:hypothetical protein